MRNWIGGRLEASMLAKLIKMRGELDVAIEKARDKLQAPGEEGFEASLEYTHWCNVREIVENAILEMELWHE
jgi:hypothetical protein